MKKISLILCVLFLFIGCSQSQNINEETQNIDDSSLLEKIPDITIDSNYNLNSNDRTLSVSDIKKILGEYDDIYYYDLSDNHIIVQTSMINENVNVGLASSAKEIIVYDYIKKDVITRYDVSHLNGEISYASYVDGVIYFTLIKPSDSYDIKIYSVLDNTITELLNAELSSINQFLTQSIAIKTYNDKPYVAISFLKGEEIKNQILELNPTGYRVVKEIENANMVNINSVVDEKIFIDIKREDGFFIGIYSENDYSETENHNQTGFAILNDFILTAKSELIYSTTRLSLLEIYDFNENLIDSRRIEDFSSGFFSDNTNKIFIYGSPNYLLQLDDDNKIILSTIQIDNMQLEGKVLYQFSGDKIFVDARYSSTHKDEDLYSGIYTLN